MREIYSTFSSIYTDDFPVSDKRVQFPMICPQIRPIRDGYKRGPHVNFTDK